MATASIILSKSKSTPRCDICRMDEVSRLTHSLARSINRFCSFIITNAALAQYLLRMNMTQGLECLICNQPPLICAPLLQAVRQSVERHCYDSRHLDSAIECLLNDNEWKSADSTTKQSVLRFVDIHRHPYLIRPFVFLGTGLKSIERSVKNGSWIITLNHLRSLLRLGLPINIPSTDDMSDTLWHYSLMQLRINHISNNKPADSADDPLFARYLYELLNLLFQHNWSHPNNEIPWKGAIGSPGILDEAMARRIPPPIIEAFVIAGG
jgi:hypothetical protein